MQRLTFDDLNSDVVEQIFNYLEIEDLLLRAALVCKQFNREAMAVERLAMHGFFKYRSIVTADYMNGTSDDIPNDAILIGALSHHLKLAGANALKHFHTRSLIISKLKSKQANLKTIDKVEDISLFKAVNCLGFILMILGVIMGIIAILTLFASRRSFIECGAVSLGLLASGAFINMAGFESYYYKIRTNSDITNLKDLEAGLTEASPLLSKNRLAGNV